MYVCTCTYTHMHIHILKTLTYTFKNMFSSYFKVTSLDKIARQCSWSSKYLRKSFQGSQVSGENFWWNTAETGVSCQEKDEQIISIEVRNIIYVLPRKPRGKWWSPSSTCTSSLFAAQGCCVRIHCLAPSPKGKCLVPGDRSCTWETHRLAASPWLSSTLKRFLGSIKFNSWKSSQMPNPWVYRWETWCTFKGHDLLKDDNQVVTELCSKPRMAGS